MMMHRRDRENTRTSKKYESQNDIKKLRRENEQLRREIWCLREEYDKLEEILKSQQNRADSEDNEEYSQDEVSTSDIEDDEDEEEKEEEQDDEKEEKKEKKIDKKEKLLTLDGVIQDELLENAENQKLSSEKTNSLHRLHVEFDQLSVVDEEEESTKKEKEYRDVNEAKVLEVKRESESNKQEEGYLNQHAFNWIINSECPVTHSTTEYSLPYTSTFGIVTTLNNESSSPLGIGWQRKIFEGDTSHTTTTTTDRQTCAESILPSRASFLSRDTSTVFPDIRSFTESMKVTPNIIATSSSSENTTSTIIHKTSPDICVAGAIASQRTFGSSDQLSAHEIHDTLNKSHSCQELDKSHTFLLNINQAIEAKSLPDNSNTRAFKSQLKIQLNNISPEILPELPPKMPPIDWLPGQPLYRSLEPIDRREQRLLRQLQLNEYQATSFESPTPRNFNFSSAIAGQTLDRSSRSERKVVPVWPNIPSTPKVDTQTQTRSRSSSQSRSPTRSQSRSSIEQDAQKETKSPKTKTNKKKSPSKKVTTSIVSTDDSKCHYESKTDRTSSSSGHEWQKKHVKNVHSSLNSKRRSTRSRSITQGSEILETTTRDRTISASSPESDKFRKNSIGSDSVPWCACWGNGCL
ncbi:myb-like protein X isoform X2 [Chelonus insularis]|uniref:myb-like protein X isoform X2 n=1 Tax=Chelonus insularis TaxID=460826 RepID=UPI00158D3518|nr:myb-like protein X isoform X2 [Chelonus insularis]